MGRGPVDADSPWRWPLIVFASLIIIVIGGVVISLSGCSPEEPRPSISATVSDVTDNLDSRYVSTFSTTLPSGKKVECVSVTYRGSALQCWEVVR